MIEDFVFKLPTKVNMPLKQRNQNLLFMKQIGFHVFSSILLDIKGEKTLYTHTCTHTHTHIYMYIWKNNIYIYIYIYIYVCVCTTFFSLSEYADLTL